jgi:hypothetical protein
MYSHYCAQQASRVLGHRTVVQPSASDALPFLCTTVTVLCFRTVKYTACTAIFCAPTVQQVFPITEHGYTTEYHNVVFIITITLYSARSAVRYCSFLYSTKIAQVVSDVVLHCIRSDRSVSA